MAAMIALPGTAPPGASAIEMGPTERPGNLTPSRLFGDRTLTPMAAQAACGPAAAMAFARAVGRTVSLDSAVAVAKEVGWAPKYGMSGSWGQLQLLRRLNVPATLETGVNASKIAREVQAGRRWFSLSELTALGTSVPTHTLFVATAGAPTVPASASSGNVASMSGQPATAIGSLVMETGGLGARLRRAPGTASAVLANVADGTQLVDASASTTVVDRVCRRAPTGGVVDWVDSGLLK